MAESSWPCPNHNSRAVTDTEYEQLTAPSTANGIVGVPTDLPPVFGDSSGRQVKVRAGTYGLVRGHEWTSGPTDVVKTIAANSAGSTRYDLVVLRFDRSTLDVSTAVVQGTAGSGPPSVTQQTGTTGVYEIPLAKVTVVNGASTIAATDVTSLAWYLGQAGVVCTSATRPPHAMGLRIYEQDTTRSYVSTGSSWLQTGGPTPNCELQRVAALSLANGASQAVPWDTVITNGDGVWDSGNPTRITLPIPGKWRILCTLFAGIFAGSGQRYAWYQIGGATGRVSEVYQDVGSGGGAGLQPVVEQRFAAPTYLELWVTTSGNSSPVNFAAQGITMSAEFIRP